MYKNANGMLPPVMNELFTVNSNIHEHNTRQRLMLHTDRGHTNIFYRSFKDLMQRKKKKYYFSFYIDNILIKTSSI